MNAHRLTRPIVARTEAQIKAAARRERRALARYIAGLVVVGLALAAVIFLSGAGVI